MGNEFLVLKGTKVTLEGRTVLASGDFLVSFEGRLLTYVHKVKSRVNYLVIADDNPGHYVDCTTEYGIATIDIADLLTMH